MGKKDEQGRTLVVALKCICQNGPDIICRDTMPPGSGKMHSHAFFLSLMVIQGILPPSYGSVSMTLGLVAPSLPSRRSVSSRIEQTLSFDHRQGEKNLRNETKEQEAQIQSE